MDKKSSLWFLKRNWMCMSLYRCLRINQAQRDSGSPGHLIHTAHLSLSQRITALYHMVAVTASHLTWPSKFLTQIFFFHRPILVCASKSTDFDFNRERSLHVTDLEQTKLCFVTTSVFISELTTYQNKYMGVKQLGLGREQRGGNDACRSQERGLQ